MPGDQDFIKTQVSSDLEAMAEIEKKTKQLSMVSAELFEARRNFYAWRNILDKAVSSGKLEVQSRDPRNYRQIITFPGKTNFGENPMVAEIQYGDDFHKGDGQPKLVSYSSYQYFSDGKKEIEKFSPSLNQQIYIIYHEQVNSDGSKTINEQKGSEWVKTEYDSSGNKVEK